MNLKYNRKNYKSNLVEFSDGPLRALKACYTGRCYLDDL